MYNNCAQSELEAHFKLNKFTTVQKLLVAAD